MLHEDTYEYYTDDLEEFETEQVFQDRIYDESHHDSFLDDTWDDMFEWDLEVDF